MLHLNGMLEKHQAIYIPKKYSTVDVALAHFLNGYPERDKLKILFVRESEGVYQFGSKRVYLKIEKGNNILVRIGGGFMDIKTFIEKFTAQESQKYVSRQDVFRRLQ